MRRCARSLARHLNVALIHRCSGSDSRTFHRGDHYRGARSVHSGSSPPSLQQHQHQWQADVVQLLYHGEGEAAFTAWQRAAATDTVALSPSSSSYSSPSALAAQTLTAPTVVALSLYTLIVERDAVAAADMLLLLPASMGKGEEGLVAYTRALCALRGGSDKGKCSDYATAGARAAASDAVAWLLPFYEQQLQRQVSALTLCGVSVESSNEEMVKHNDDDVTGALVLLLVSLRTDADLQAQSSLSAAVLEATRTLIKAKAASASGDGENVATEAAAAGEWVAAAQKLLASSTTTAANDQNSLIASGVPTALLRTPAVFFAGLSSQHAWENGLRLYQLLWHSLHGALETTDSRVENGGWVGEIASPGRDITLASWLLLAGCGTGHDTSKAATPAVDMVTFLCDKQVNTASATRCLQELAQAPLPMAVTTTEGAAVKAVAHAIVHAAFTASTANKSNTEDGRALETLGTIQMCLGLESSHTAGHSADTVPLASTIAATAADNAISASLHFRRHPRALEGFLTALVAAQKAGHHVPSIKDSNKQRPHSRYMSHPAWRRFIERLLTRNGQPLPLTVSSQGADGTSTSATVTTNSTFLVALDPLVMAGLHRGWWLPRTLCAVPCIARGTAQRLHTQTKIAIGMLDRSAKHSGCGGASKREASPERLPLAVRVAAATAITRGDNSDGSCSCADNGAGVRRAVGLLSRWEWVVEAIDALEAPNTKRSDSSRNPAKSEAALVLAQAVAVTLHRCHVFYRQDLGKELAELLLLPTAITYRTTTTTTTATTTTTGNAADMSCEEGEGGRQVETLANTLLGEILHTVWKATYHTRSSPPGHTSVAMTDADWLRSPAGATVRRVVCEVCRWCPDRLASFSALASLYGATTTTAAVSKAAAHLPTARMSSCPRVDVTQWISMVAADIARASLPTPPLSPASIRCEAATTPTAPITNVAPAAASASPSGAAEAAHAMFAARLLRECPRAVLGPPSQLPLVLRALRLTMTRDNGAAAVEEGEKLLLRLTEEVSLSSTAITAAPRSTNSGKGDHSGTVSKDQHAGHALQSACNTLAAVAVNAVLLRWTWANMGIENEANPDTFCKRLAAVSAILFPQHHAFNFSPKPSGPVTVVNTWVAQRVPPATQTGLRLLFLLYCMQRRALCVQAGDNHNILNGEEREDTSNKPAVGLSVEESARLLAEMFHLSETQSATCAPQNAVASAIARLCRREAPELLGLYAAAAQRIVCRRTPLADALIHEALLPSRDSRKQQRQRPSSASLSSASRTVMGTAARVTAATLPKKATVHARMDTGDWAGALAIVFDVYAGSPLHGVRKALRACESARPHAGVAWVGALRVWHYAQQQQQSHLRQRSSVPLNASALPRNKRERRLQRRAVREAAAAASTATPTSANSKPVSHLLGLPEVGRIATILACGHRWHEALTFFDSLDTATQVDGYVVTQVAYALRASAEHADDVLALWARWRARVGDGVAPTSAMVRALVEAGLVGAQGRCADAACRLVKAATQQLSVSTASVPPTPSTVSPGSASPASSSSTSSATSVTNGQRDSHSHPTRSIAIPLQLDDPRTAHAVERLLCTRWHESWQSALAVAVASGQPALVQAVAAHSPLRPAIYHAGVAAVGGQPVRAGLDAAGRVALAQHIFGGHGSFLCAAAACGEEKSEKEDSGNAKEGEEGTAEDTRDHEARLPVDGVQPPATPKGAVSRANARSRVKQEAENVDRLLKDLLGD